MNVSANTTEPGIYRPVRILLFQIVHSWLSPWALHGLPRQFIANKLIPSDALMLLDTLYTSIPSPSTCP
jgi:hypothetical protein